MYTKFVIELIIVCPKLLFLSHLDNLNKYTHIFERSAIEIDARKKIQDIFIDI